MLALVMPSATCDVLYGDELTALAGNDHMGPFFLGKGKPIHEMAFTPIHEIAFTQDTLSG